MEATTTAALVTGLAMIGMVIIVAALLSGVIERTGLPQVAVFLGLGAAIGPLGLGLIDVQLDSPLLRLVATLSLALVLFTDAVSLDIREVRQHAGLALRVLGPGTLLSAAVVGLAAWWLLGLPPAGAAILGAALASTDPVLLRGLLRRRDVPAAARQGLRLESGLNDVVLLPVVLVAMAVLVGGTGENANWPRLALDLFVLGPGAGILVGLLAVATLDLVRRRVGVRRDYESLYALGVAFTAFAAAEAVHGSGFLAAFAAGLTITALDVELCDCFLEYGETTSEMLLLFTFVLFGGSLIWSGLSLLSVAAVAFVLIAVLARLPIYALALAWAPIDRRSRLLITWFGPRGLSSLLLVLLPVFAMLPGSQRLFEACCLVVLVSVVLHGGSPLVLDRLLLHRRRRNGDQPPPADGPLSSSSSGLPVASAAPAAVIAPDTGVEGGVPPDRITVEQVMALRARGEPVVLLDVRTERSYDGSNVAIAGSARLPPDRVAERAAELGLARQAWLIAACT